MNSQNYVLIRVCDERAGTQIKNIRTWNDMI